MKKHLYGFTFFCLIIGIGSEVADYRLAGRTNEEALRVSADISHTVRPPGTIEPERTAGTLALAEAVFNKPTGQLHLKWVLSRRDKTSQKVNFNLHFYLFDGKETRFLGTERGRTTFGMNLEDLARIDSTVSCNWLGKISSNANIFVRVEPGDSDTGLVFTEPIEKPENLVVPIVFDYSMDDYNEIHSPKGC